MTGTKSKLSDKLKQFGPCADAVRWLDSQSSEKSAWANCERGDWMLWLIGKLSGPPESEARKKLALAACDCARLALPHFEKQYPKDNRPRECIEVAERWANGSASIGELRKARNAAAAADAAADAAYAAARKDTLKKCADIVRQHYPKPPRLRNKR